MFGLLKSSLADIYVTPLPTVEPMGDVNYTPGGKEDTAMNPGKPQEMVAQPSVQENLIVNSSSNRLDGDAH